MGRLCAVMAVVVWLAAGCATAPSFAIWTTNWVSYCAWCGKECYSSSERGWNPYMNENEYCATVRKVGIHSDDGYLTCSLRCKNAYESSRGVKEERHRIIDGE